MDDFGHVDPTMWAIQDGEENLTLEEDMPEIMRRVQRLRINNATVEDRLVLVAVQACDNDNSLTNVVASH